MRILSTFFALALAVQSLSLASAPAFAAKSKSKTQKSKAKKAKTSKLAKARKVKKLNGNRADLSTDIKFDDSVLHGQYQSPEEAMARVEDEKMLSDLLGVRMHFKDRLKQQSDQE